MFETPSSTAPRHRIVKTTTTATAEADPAPAVAPAAGPVNVANIVSGDPVTDSLDALVDLVAELRNNDSVPLSQRENATQTESGDVVVDGDVLREDRADDLRLIQRGALIQGRSLPLLPNAPVQRRAA
ncbi:hypothetical protein PJI20_10270 [Mycobacterium kansasii]